MSDVGPTENTASTTSAPAYDEGWGDFAIDLVEGFSPLWTKPAPAPDQREYSTTNVEAAPAAPNYTPIAIAVGVGALALAWALK